MTRRLLVTTVIAGALLAPASAEAVKLRRPYAPAIARNYGFDNNGGAAGCRDYMCKSACYDTHTGTDFPVPLGTNVLAGAAGKVVTVVNACANYGSVGNSCGGYCGNYVKIRHPDGDETLYCHMMRDSLTVKVGDTVGCGQKIGRSASSGSSSGPHLHLAVAPGGGTRVDVYAGPCTGSKGYWVDPTSYGAPPGASCACAPSAEVCNGVDDDCDGAVDEGGVCCTPGAEVCNGKDDDCDGKVDEDEVCEIDELLQTPETYAPTRTSDVDGDRRADVCGRGSSGLFCMVSQGSSFTKAASEGPFGDAAGFGDLRYATTLRMGDVDGDGRADVCARTSSGVVCHRSTGGGFGAPITGPEWSDAHGWLAPRFLTTLRLADVDGDGRDDLCARAAAGLVCARSNGGGFDGAFDGPRWSDESGFGSAKYYGTLRMGDVDGDGRDDACIRHSGGIECWRSTGSGFEGKVDGPAWRDDQGWGAPQYWSTIRLADVNGDRKADLCARSSTSLACHFSTGDGFGPAIEVAPLADAAGWNDPTNYRTLRVADVDGDGAMDLCARSDGAVECWRWNGAAFVNALPGGGPKLSDDQGWAPIRYHGTLMLADATGDRRADLFARAIAGGQVFASAGGAFGDGAAVGEFSDEGGWGDAKYWSTLRFGGPRCVPSAEACNGRDDDCDGEVDEGAVCAEANGPDAGAPGADADPSRDLEGSCGCRAPGSRGAPDAGVAVAIAAACAAIASRRRRAP
ncbi:MAG: VCBS repeat domain-containing M23 family metallopeptidase [Deltaproteobacteria bacterium]|nr:VCBS repeat domain-containing M23 family metallopeptidase [Deltaproteobacteria bacterium]